MVKDLLERKIADNLPGLSFDVLIPPDGKMGDYSTNAAFALAKKEGKDSISAGDELVNALKKDKELADIFEKIEVAKPGYVNFFLSEKFLKKQLEKISKEKEYGFNKSKKGKTVMVEYTDANPFKLFHIGHLMSNTIGESIARLYEASGAKVIRANYQGDVGLHVAKAIWGMSNMENGMWNMEKIGQAYAKGAKAYEENENSKKEIDEINNKIYDRSDKEINELYDKGKKQSLEYFEAIYKKLGTKFDRYFFESEAGPDGVDIVKKHPDIFVESDGATVFKGEGYGLHTRVFINSQGLPTYEAKELGLNKKKFKKDNPDLSIIITGNEINDYFKVLLKVMELTMPEVAAKTKHISPAESLIEQTKSKLPESDNVDAMEKIAIGAIKYSILKQSPGHDIVFDFEKSLSVKGDSAPYLQYTYARLNNIVAKAGKLSSGDAEYLTEPVELAIIRRLLMFPDVVLESGEKIAPQHLALYLYELSNDANRFYESIHVLDDENSERKNARLVLVKTVATILERGLNLLGISALPRI